jgi:hypothetical protein
MNTHYNHQRRTHLEREHRLCHESTPERMGRAVGSFAESIVDVTIDSASGLYKGLEKAWNADTRSNAEKAKSIAMLGQFQATMPQSIAQIVTSGLETEDIDLAQIDSLVKYEDWITAFEDPALFDETLKPIQPLSLAAGPMGVLLSKSGPDRQLMLFDFGKEFIPREVRDEHPVEYDAILADPSKISGAGRATAISTLKAMFGVDVPADPTLPEAKIAESALRHRYWKDGNREDLATGERYKVADPSAGDNPTGPLEVNGTTETLFEEASGHMKTSPGITSTARLGSVLPPSLLAGAIKMGVVDNEEFASLDTFLDEKNKATVENNLATRKNLLEDTGVIEANLSREMTGFTDIFHNMGGVEKIALIVFALYLAKKQPKIPMALGGLYFAQKFFLKMDNPIDDAWSPVLQGMAKKFNGLARPGMEAVGINFPNDPSSIEDIDRLADMMSNYVSKSARNNADSAAQGFALLAEMPLNTLAPYLVIGESGQMVLDASNQNLQDMLGQKLRRKGLDEYGALDFFTADQKDADGNITLDHDSELKAKFGPTVNKNLVDAGSVLGHVYFTKGAKIAGPASDAVKMIEFARQRTPGGRYDKLSNAMEYNGVVVNPRKEYLNLVRKGMQNPGSETLGAFVQAQMGLSDSTPEEVENERSRKFEANKDELLVHTHAGARYKLDVKKDGTSVKIGIPGQPDYDMTETFDTFIGNTFDAEAITNKWIAKTEADLLVLGTDPSPAGTAIGSLKVTFNGSEVKFQLGALPTGSHKTTLELFKKHSKADFYKKIDAWGSATVPPDRAVDPLQ